MSLRGDMIRRARRRVDARRDARRADIRDQARATYGRDLGKRRFAPTEPSVGSGGDAILNEAKRATNLAGTMGEDLILNPARKGINKFGEAIFPLGQKALKGLDSLMSNVDRSKQNREILGDAYTDDLRKSMMTDDDLDFYNKYVGLADLASDNQERERLMGIANTAMQNAQITNRINYTLGQPEFGFETTAPAAQAAFGETPEQLKERIDYSTLVDRMVGGTDDSVGLKGSAIGKAFLADAYKEADKETGGSLISDAIMNYRDPIRDMVAPTATGQSMVADLNPRTPPLSESELMNVSEQNLIPTYDYNTYGDPMDNILSGEPGSGTGSLLLQSMYPGYSDFADTDRAQKYGLEDMNEFELMQFGYKNPTLANLFGFNPSYEFE
jgi:hypothetical protein